MKEIRNLTADEIEVRVQSVMQNGCILLIYKNARSDQKILDETFSPFNWQRSHQEVNGNLFCTVSIWDEEKNAWVSKQDAGKESNTEKEKGHASDSFKRACVNWGIGRELYTSPFIWVYLETSEIDINTKTNKPQLAKGVEFSVKEIEYKGKEITKLIIQDKFEKTRFSFPKTAEPKPKSETELITECSEKIDNAKSIEELHSIWLEYKSLQSHELIELKKNNKKAQLQSLNKNEEEDWR